MKEVKGNLLIDLKRQMQELSDGLCDIGPGPMESEHLRFLLPK